MSTLKKSEVLGREIRQDPPEELGVSTLTRLKEAIDRGDKEEAKRLAEYLRKEGEVVHDVYTNWVWGFLTYVANEFGEDEVENALRKSMEPWFGYRYRNYAKMTPEERLQLTLEGMRGHYVGPGRLGQFEVIDEGKRWKMVFDPCGSGGVMRRGNPETGDPPRTEPPYNFGETQEAHPWSWGRKGVCYYCAHCSLINEILPIEHFGEIMRVTEYPDDPNDPCVWYIYKDAKDIPDEYYERVGKKKPG